MKRIKQIVTLCCASVVFLQALSGTIQVAGSELRKIGASDTYGTYYQEDLEKEQIEQAEVATEEKEILTKEASLHEDASEYEGYKEVIEKRTENSKTYDIGNHTYIQEMYFEPIHKEVNGQYEEIDNDLVNVSRARSLPIYENKDGLYDFYANTNQATMKNKQGESITWEYEDGDFSRSDVKENVMLFTEVYENIDLEYVLRGDKVYTTYFLNGKMNHDTIKYRVNTKGLEAKEEKEYIDLINEQGESVYKLIHPKLSDANGRIGSTSITFTQVNLETIEVEIQFDQDWVNAEDRVYPVKVSTRATLDSSFDDIAIASSYVRSYQGNLLSSQYSDLYVGYDFNFFGGANSNIGIARSYIHIARPDLGVDQKVISAYLQLYKEQDGSDVGVANQMGRTIETYKTSSYVDPYGLTWNTQPDPSSWTHLSTTSVVGPKSQYYNFDITSYISDIYNGQNKTLVLKATDESSNWYANVFNSESTDKRQRLQITYRDDWDVDPALGINIFDTELRVTAKENQGFQALSFDGIAKPYYFVEFHLKEKLDDDTRTSINTIKSMSEASKKFLKPIFVSNPKGSSYKTNPPYAPSEESGNANYTTNYVEESSIPKFDTFYEYYVQVVKGSDKSTKDFYSDGFIKYKVKNGDTIKGIASYYGVTVDALKEDNNLTKNTVQEDQILLVRFKKDNPKVPKDVYTPPLKTVTYEAKFVDRGPKCYGSCAYGDPINTNTGNFYHEAVDFTLNDYEALSLTRYYNSTGPQLSNMFGNGFTTPLEQYLGYDKAGNILFFRGDGKILQIKKEGNTFQPSKTDRIAFEIKGKQIEIQDIENGKTYVFDDYGTLIKIVEKSGFETTIVYNAYGQIEKIKLGEKTIQFVYNENNLVKEVKLPSGKSTTYAYDKSRNLIKATDTLGYSEEYTYDANNFLTSVQDRRGNKIANNTYDSEGAVQSQKDGNGNAIYFDYAEGETVISHEDGIRLTYEHENNKATKIINGDGTYSSYTYDENGNIITKTDAQGAITTYTYDVHDLTKVEYPDGTSEVFTYNLNHQIIFHKAKDDTSEAFTYDGKDIIKHTKSNGEETTYTYDAQHHVVSETNHLGVTKTYTYLGNQIASITHTSGLVERFTYDANGNLTVEKDNQGKQIVYAYNDNNQVIKKTYTDDTSEQWKYDGNHNVMEYVDRLGGLSAYTYDKNNNVIKITKGEQTTTKTYDMYNQVIAETNEQGLTTQYVYDDNFRKVENIDVYGNKTKYTYDALDQLLETTNVHGKTETNAYENGQMVKQVGYDGLVTTYEYDAYGRMTKQTNPNGTMETKVYDEQGNIIKEVDNQSQTTLHEYDHYGREVKRIQQVGEGEIVSEFTYDQYNQISKKRVDEVETTYTYDVYGQERTITDALGNTTHKAYDFDGNVVEEVDALGNTQTTVYDGNGNIIKEVDKNGNTSTKTYDVNNFLMKETDAMGYTTTYTYNDKGQCSSSRDAYGVVTTFGYDDYNQIIEREVDGMVIETKAYDNFGQEIETKNISEHTTTIYDDFGRVSSQKNEYTGLVTTNEYDVYGNIVKMKDSEGQTTTKTYDLYQREINSVDAYGRKSETTYDVVGNVIETKGIDGTIKHTYDIYGNVLSSTSELGLTTLYVYNELHQKVKEQVEGKETTYLYDANQQVIEVNDKQRGLVSKTVYDANGNVVEAEDALGNKTIKVYDRKNQVIEEVDKNGNVSKWEYDANGNVVKTIDALGNTTQTTYNNLGQKEMEVDERGFAITYLYDEAGRFVEVIDKLGNSAYVEYNEANQVAKEIDGNGNEKTYQYDVYGRVVKETDGRGISTTKQYDVLGNVVKEQKENRITTNSYDAKGNLIQIKVNNRVIQKYVYNEYNQLAVAYDGLNQKTTYKYDRFGNQTEVNEKGYKTISSYNVYGERSKQVENDRYEQTYTYDALSRLVETKTNGKVSLQVTYDANGNEIQRVEYQKPQEIVYDALNRPIELKISAAQGDAMIMVQKVVYDEVGNAIEIEDGNGNKERKKYDANNNEVSFTNAKGVTQTFAYDANNNLIKAQNAQGRVVTYGYDANNNVIVKDLNGRYAFYTYDVQDNVTLEMDEYGYNHRYTYDVYGNQTSHQKPDGTTVRYEYDENNNKIKQNKNTFTYDKRGNLTSATNEVGSVQYTYDAFDQITSVRDTNDKTISYTYNKDKNLTKIDYANGDQVTYQYNAYNLMSKVQKNGEEIAAYTYNKRGEVIKLKQQDVLSTYVYDAVGNVVQKDTEKGSDKIHTTSFAYDENDNLIKEVINGKTNTYAYNDADELKESKKYIDEELVTTTYGYDLFGNKTVSSSKEGRSVYTYNERNQLEKVESEKGIISYYYNENGNLKNKVKEDGSNEVYKYNDDDQLIQMSQGAFVYDYTYDAQGEKVKQTKTDIRDYPMSVWYDYYERLDFEDVKASEIKDTFDILREQVKKKEASGGVCEYIGSDSYPSTYKKKPEVTRYTLDRNQEYTQILEKDGKSNVYGVSLLEENNVTQVTGLNNSVVAEVRGNDVVFNSYSDYGASKKKAGHYYNGEYTEETGLIYLRARYYDPSIGSFIQIDNNYAGEKEDVATQNRYNYTLSNPYKYVDRDGNRSVKLQKLGKTLKPPIVRVVVADDLFWLFLLAAAAAAASSSTNKSTGFDGSVGDVIGGIGNGIGSFFNQFGKATVTVIKCMLPSKELPEKFLQKMKDKEKAKEKEKERKENPSKSESEVWKELDNVKGKDRKTSGHGRDQKFYEWDHTHGDIEVYDRNGKHLGSMDPTTGEMYKPPVPGRTMGK